MLYVINISVIYIMVSLFSTPQPIGITSFPGRIILFFLLCSHLTFAKPSSFLKEIKLSTSLNLGSSFYLGTHKNAKVIPNGSAGFFGSATKQFSTKWSGGLSLGFDADYQSIRSNSNLYQLNYTRKMVFLSYGFLANFRFKDNSKWLFSNGFFIRQLISGSLIKSGFKLNNNDLSREELYIRAFRRFTPGIQFGVYRRLSREGYPLLLLGVITMFSIVSSDFKYQPGTLNQLQLSLKLNI
jgi:hypothetical protein